MPRHDASAEVKKAKLDVLRHFGFLFYGIRQALVEVWEMKYTPVEVKASQLPRSIISTKSSASSQKATTERQPRQQTQKPNPAGLRKNRPSLQKHRADDQILSQQNQNQNHEEYQSDALDPPTLHFQSRCLAKWDITDSEHILELASFSAKVYKWGHYEFLKDYTDSLSSILRPPKGTSSPPHELWTASEMWAYWQCAASLGSSATDGSRTTAGQDTGTDSNPWTKVPEPEQDDVFASGLSATNTADITAEQGDGVPSNLWATNTTTESSSFTHDTPGVVDG